MYDLPWAVFDPGALVYPECPSTGLHGRQTGQFSENRFQRPANVTTDTIL